MDVFLSFHLLLHSSQENKSFPVVSVRFPQPHAVGVVSAQGWKDNIHILITWSLAHSRHLSNVWVEQKFRYSTRQTFRKILTPWDLHPYFLVLFLRDSEGLLLCLSISPVWLVKAWVPGLSFPLRCKGLTSGLLLICIRNSSKALTSKDKISNKVSWEI